MCSVSQSVVPEPAAAARGYLLEMNFLGPTPDQLNQILGGMGWAQETEFVKPAFLLHAQV